MLAHVLFTYMDVFDTVEGALLWWHFNDDEVSVNLTTNHYVWANSITHMLNILTYNIILMAYTN